MAWSVSVNGTDLADYGFALQDTEGVFDSLTRNLQEIWIPHRGMLYTSPARVEERVGVLIGGMTTGAKTVSALETAMDKIKSALTSGFVRVVKDNGATTPRLIDGYVAHVSLKPVDHPAATADVRARIVVKCPTPYWRVEQPKIRALQVAGTRYTIPLGTASSTPIIRLIGSSTNPTVTYTDASGTAIKTLTPTVTLVGGTHWLDIDMRTALMTLYASGVASNVTSFTGDFPWAFDTQDGDWATEQWPGLSVSAGTGLAYWWQNYL